MTYMIRSPFTMLFRVEIETDVGERTICHVSRNMELGRSHESYSPSKINWAAWGSVESKTATAFATGLRIAVIIAKEIDDDPGEFDLDEFKGSSVYKSLLEDL